MSTISASTVAETDEPTLERESIDKEHVNLDATPRESVVSTSASASDLTDTSPKIASREAHTSESSPEHLESDSKHQSHPASKNNSVFISARSMSMRHYAPYAEIIGGCPLDTNNHFGSFIERIRVKGNPAEIIRESVKESSKIIPNQSISRSLGLLKENPALALSLGPVAKQKPLEETDLVEYDFSRHVYEPAHIPRPPKYIRHQLPKEQTEEGYAYVHRALENKAKALARSAQAQQAFIGCNLSSVYPNQYFPHRMDTSVYESSLYVARSAASSAYTQSQKVIGGDTEEVGFYQ